MSNPRDKKKGRSVRHRLIGAEVSFRGSMWRVIAAHASDEMETPWLTLKRGIGEGGQIEAVAKPHEVDQVLN